LAFSCPWAIWPIFLPTGLAEHQRLGLIHPSLVEEAPSCLTGTESEGKRPKRDPLGLGKRGVGSAFVPSALASDAIPNVAPRISRYELAPNRVPTKAQTAGDSLAPRGTLTAG
jgi:hypothetical protein